MKIDVDQVEWIARLAHLELSAEEKAEYAGQLSTILDYFARLDQVDTRGVPAMSHPFRLQIALRPDEPRASYPPPAILANAPDHDDNLFRAPLALDRD